MDGGAPLIGRCRFGKGLMPAPSSYLPRVLPRQKWPDAVFRSRSGCGNSPVSAEARRHPCDCHQRQLKRAASSLGRRSPGPAAHFWAVRPGSAISVPVVPTGSAGSQISRDQASVDRSVVACDFLDPTCLHLLIGSLTKMIEGAMTDSCSNQIT